MFYISQILSILAAIFIARHDATAVNHFSDHGFPGNMAQFHSNNFRLKGVIVTGLSLMILLTPGAWFLNYFFDAVCAGVANSFWIWLVFDPILNKTRKRGFGWDYLGLDNGTDRKMIKWFGKRAGQMKALICLIFIAAANIVYLFIK